MWIKFSFKTDFSFSFINPEDWRLALNNCVLDQVPLSFELVNDDPFFDFCRKDFFGSLGLRSSLDGGNLLEEGGGDWKSITEDCSAAKIALFQAFMATILTTGAIVISSITRGMTIAFTIIVLSYLRPPAVLQL